MIFLWEMFGNFPATFTHINDLQGMSVSRESFSEDKR